MQFRKEEEDNFAMEMTPLIDVVFLLIIFFMVSTVFVDFSRHLDINLPTSKSSVFDEKSKTIEIEMSKDKQIFLAGKKNCFNFWVSLDSDRLQEILDGGHVVQGNERWRNRSLE